MKRALSPSFASKVALVIALAAAPRVACATVLMPAAAPQATAVHKTTAARNPLRARVRPVVNVAAFPPDLPVGDQPAAERRYGWMFAPEAVMARSEAWLFLLLAAALICPALLANTRFACHVFGHRRSKRALRFDDRRHQWVSTCKRCKVELCRDGYGDWLVASDARAKSLVLKPVAGELGRYDGVRASRAPADRNGRPPVNAPVQPRNGDPRVTNGPERDAAGAHTMVAQLLDNVLAGNVAPPGARGALFFVVDQLRARPGMDEQARLAEEISIEIQHLQSALQRGAQEEAALARRQLSASAGEWMKNAPQAHPC